MSLLRVCAGSIFSSTTPTPITATSASGQANTLVAFNDREFIAMYAPP
ncbi:Uncharacterised protein [Mycobacterium tuberculosis]|uniref:Uncharacterized protein n=1 Tax=Mycobacterium tuberculosis TaxID=1773 RepID=A0A0U0R830_MYCTX|nr:Uncharacterised protein [Mycobacterium tuberculosis]